VRDFQARKLGELVDILSGFAFASEKFDDSGKMPIIRIRDVLVGRSATFYQGEYDPKFLIRDGEILIGMDGEFNRARWQGGPALLNQRVCRISPSNGELDGAYLFHFLPNALKAIEDATPYVTVKHLSVTDIRDISIPLPPLSEQRRIAELLDRAEALRAKRRAAIAQLDTLTQSIFLDLFGDPVENPRGWPENKSLGEVADIVSGVTKGRSLQGKSTREVPYLAVVNVQDRFLNMSVVKNIVATEAEIRQFTLIPDDLLLTEGGDPDKLGRGTLWKGELPECIHQNHVFRVRLKSSALHPLFLNWLVGSSRGKRYFLRSAKQTTGIASINMTQLRGFPLFIPPINLQHQFACRVAAVEKLNIASRASLAELTALFAVLQHRAFQGELFGAPALES
jgi:type I restriction enzyme S subunit